METVHSLGSTLDWVIIVIYFIAILLFGSYFGKYNKDTNDFFFAGRRFSWWLVAMSIVATGVSSHSFIKYSAKGLEHGFSSSMAYLNDWFFLPFFIFGWLPIIVYSRVRSIPEYFERRFSPGARFLVTFIQLLYLIGYSGIGFLTMAKALQPMLPPYFNIFGIQITISMMGIVGVTAFIVGVYITFGGQIAVIFTDLVQGFTLLIAGAIIFFLGAAYVGGWDAFWNLLPTSWKLPLAGFNSPPDFNFVGIFWQDGVAGSIGFLFMNMGLVLRFMSAKSVNEGRKAATFNILFMLPLSAIVVSCGGWIGKAISEMNSVLIPTETHPDNIFVVVANLVSVPGIFGFVIAALSAALMSTVNTYLNACSAIYINDIDLPIRRWISKTWKSKYINANKENEKRNLLNARISSVVFTILAVLAVIPFSVFPTVYEAHGFFHSTITPPLVVAIFLGVFWKRFSPMSVIVTLIGGVSLMILGYYYPQELVGPFDHGTEYSTKYPYTYIQALYNTVVCVLMAVTSTYLAKPIDRLTSLIKAKDNHKNIISIFMIISVCLFIIIILDLFSLEFLLFISFVLASLVAITASYFVPYDEERHTQGLTVWSLARAKEEFKGGKINEKEGKKVIVNWKLKEIEDDFAHFSVQDMETMQADVNDMVYISDKRKWLGGLKSIHTRYGIPHNENGVVYISKAHLEHGQFVKMKLLEAEKEM
jgi:SSS family solute:Na+ symporter